MPGIILVMIILLVPAVMAPLMLLVRRGSVREVLVSAAAVAEIAAGVLLGVRVLGRGTLIVSAGALPWARPTVTALDYLVMAAILYCGLRIREWKVVVPTVLQLAAVLVVELVQRPAEADRLVLLDNLSLTLTLVVSVMGSLIAVFALGYMRRHEAHSQKPSRQHVFFAVIFLFLFAMNAMVITDNLMYFYTFFEITTLCSFLLIGYDGTDDARESARKALWINSAGGLFMAAGILVMAGLGRSLSLSRLAEGGPAAGPLLTAVMLLCCAGYVKSAQFPFQPWLLGAMVAPTPVSALLHSSTMVKAGVYLVVRLSPVFGGRPAGHIVALAGGFTFAAAAALAIGQSNGKRVLAYSTISNLGLIVCCAGIGGPVATSAAILLIVFHAVSKGLMFLCVGTVELGIGSRNIEDMFGIFSKMPYTATIMVVGIISMVLPPFGVLITKWLALEAAVAFLPALLLIVVGSAFTIAFWVKWLGVVLTVYRPGRPKMEDLPLSIRLTLGTICGLAVALTALISPLNNHLVMPAVRSLLGKASTVEGIGGGVEVHASARLSGGFDGVLLLLGVMLAALALVRLVTAVSRPRFVPPYAGGETLAGDPKGRDFEGPGEKVGHIRTHNYYLTNIFSEPRLTEISNIVSVLLILMLFGVA